VTSFRARLAIATAAGGLVVTALAALTLGASPATLALLVVAVGGAGIAWWTSAPVAAESPRTVEDALVRLQRRLDEAERQRHAMRMRAETAGRFREEFVAAVRHELKTPLNAILGFTQVLEEEIDGPLTEQQREDVTAIRQAGQYLTGLVESVLEEWVPDREAPIHFGTVDLGPIVRDVARLLEGQTVDKPVAIRVEVAPGLPRPVGDARRLRQVLINLGTNALRATATGSVTLRAERHAEGVCVSVVDTGTGIDPELLPRLFEEFSQGGTTSSQVGGSGLGLSLTRDLVESQGGRIELDTEWGKGTTFRVVLPLELDAD
jgi:signal transduction histidine kinase